MPFSVQLQDRNSALSFFPSIQFALQTINGKPYFVCFYRVELW